MTTKTERENIMGVQKHFAGIKRKCQAEVDRWMEAKDAARANAWYKLLNKIGVVHAESTEDLLRLFPEHSDIITEPEPKGGGR